MENLPAYCQILIGALITGIIDGLALWGWYSFVDYVNNKRVKHDKEMPHPCECCFKDSCRTKFEFKHIDNGE